MDDDVGDVAVHEQLARIEVDELVGGNAAVGAADPEVFRALLREQAVKKPGRADSIFFAQRRLFSSSSGRSDTATVGEDETARSATSMGGELRR